MRTSGRSSTPFSTRRKYGVIYADPPWSFRNWSAKGTGRNAVSHYDCLDFPSLAALPFADLAADDCALFLWVTDPLLPRGLELLKAWGFEYKTVAFYWVKLNSAAKHDADFRCAAQRRVRTEDTTIHIGRPGAARLRTSPRSHQKCSMNHWKEPVATIQLDPRIQC